MTTWRTYSQMVFTRDWFNRDLASYKIRVSFLSFNQSLRSDTKNTVILCKNESVNILV
ncbi:protein of unknown function [Candidatus Nitrosotalea okcheonensis]|uniref:Uncharacterized protein n=1 Tax=Candidatus Nitrosotalea okcheonensis TaxID=1903276 RepID=A0A2H1FEI4_9ARCH|nr:protein of unknown function [Candidatus Nitrosotalea okcheonensis]